MLVCFLYDFYGIINPFPLNLSIPLAILTSTTLSTSITSMPTIHTSTLSGTIFKNTRIEYLSTTYSTGVLTYSIGRLTRTMGAKKIVVIGSTAQEALKTLGSNELRRTSVAKNCCEVVELGGSRYSSYPYQLSEEQHT
jgi:hypothetical protein